MRYYVLLAVFCLAQVNASKESSRIVIIGAGAAGITTAARLFENGFKNVTILEAEDRIGGRIHTVDLDGDLVDLGAQWIYGEENNSAFKLAWPLGVLDKSNRVYLPTKIYSSSGQLLPLDAGQSVMKLFVNLTESEIPKESSNATVGDYYTKKIAAYFEEHPEIPVEKRKPLMEMLHLHELIWDTADSWFNVSAKSSNAWSDCKGDQMINWKDKGFSLLLDIIMKKYPDPAKELPVMNNTVLCTEVTQIKYDDADGPIKVVTAKGNHYLADHVIVTTPLGVLKADHETLFDPPLPEPKINVIKSIEYGNLTKVFMRFPKPWWKQILDNDTVSVAFYWNEADRALIANDPEKSWQLGVLNLMTVEHRPHMLSSWIAAPYAQQVPETALYEQMKELYQRFLGENQNITECGCIAWSEWSKNKHFRGSYSYRSPATEKAGATAEQLVEPITKNGKPIIMFAGEATSSDNYGTVHGAMDTGTREADRLIKLYSNEKPESATEKSR